MSEQTIYFTFIGYNKGDNFTIEVFHSYEAARSFWLKKHMDFKLAEIHRIDIGSGATRALVS